MHQVLVRNKATIPPEVCLENCHTSRANISWLSDVLIYIYIPRSHLQESNNTVIVNNKYHPYPYLTCCRVFYHQSSRSRAEALRVSSNRSISQGLYMIRYHSLYPWHHHGDYDHLCSDTDRAMLPWVQKFRSVLNLSLMCFTTEFEV